MLDKIKQLIRSDRQRFDRICNINKLAIDFDRNSRQMHILEEIFLQRAYADYFPFYQDSVIVDIGAHFGYFSLFAAANSGKQAKIICVEPNQHNFQALQDNLRDAKVSNIQAHNCAIGDTNGSVKLFKGLAPNHSIIADYSLLQQDTDFETVAQHTLEHIMALHKLEHIDFLKMDCEGAEYAILEHMPEALWPKISTLSMEFHDLKDPKYNANFITTLLSAQGFKILKLAYQPTQQNLNFGKIIASRL